MTATTTLSRRQSRFVDALAAACGTQGEYSSQDLAHVCEVTGIYTCPPSWITQDSTRKVSRGVYAVPEALEVSVDTLVTQAGQQQTATPAPAVAVAPQGSVQTISSEANMALGMTGGERATLIPEKISTYVPWGHHKDIETILGTGTFCPVFVTGLSGNGKTTMIDQVCARLRRDLYRVNITTQTDEDDLLGGFRLINGETVWQDGPVVAAMEQGGVLLLDEIDLASNKIMCLQPVLEGKGVFLKKINRFVKPAPGFTVLATANTKGKGSDDGRFVGTNVLNEAFLDRFAFTMEQEYASRSTEKKILVKWMGACGAEADSEFAENLCKWAEIIRKSFLDGAVDEIVSTRRLKDAVTAWSIFGDRLKAIEMTIARFDDDTREAFRSLYTKVDAEAGQADAEAAAEEAAVNFPEASRIDLVTSFAQKEEVKARGAKWDPAMKKWHITGKQWESDQEFWNQFSPVAVAEEVVAPF